MSTISSFLSATDASLVICTRGLTKTYKGVNALQNLDLQARCHSICGFLGPNGAGKSTTTCFIPNILGDLSQAGEKTFPRIL